MSTAPMPQPGPEEVLRARVQRLENRVAELEQMVEDLGPRSGGLEDERAIYFANAREWVEQHFAATYIRPLGGEWRWCARWDDHPEALSRLEALWRSWEHHRTDPVMGIAVWYRDHLDHHLPILLGSRGPFAACTPTRHEPPVPLPTTPPGTDPGAGPAAGRRADAENIAHHDHRTRREDPR